MRIVSFDPNEPGFFALGQESVGVIALGQSAVGVIAVGQMARGVFAVGQLAVGIWGYGQLGVGVVKGVGMLALGARTVGMLPLSYWPKRPEPKTPPPKTEPVERIRANEVPMGWVELDLAALEQGNVRIDGQTQHDVVIVEAFKKKFVGAERAWVRLQRNEQIVMPELGSLRSGAEAKVELVAIESQEQGPPPARTTGQWAWAVIGGLFTAGLWAGVSGQFVLRAVLATFSD